jgi:hypothetical protein
MPLCRIFEPVCRNPITAFVKNSISGGILVWMMQPLVRPGSVGFRQVAHLRSATGRCLCAAASF